MSAAYLGASKAGDWPVTVEIPAVQCDPACSGKRAFVNRGMAVLALKRRKRWKRIRTGADGHNVHPYRCRRCGKWHIGSDHL